MHVEARPRSPPGGGIGIRVGRPGAGARPSRLSGSGPAGTHAQVRARRLPCCRNLLASVVREHPLHRDPELTVNSAKAPARSA